MFKVYFSDSYFPACTDRNRYAVDIFFLVYLFVYLFIYLFVAVFLLMSWVTYLLTCLSFNVSILISKLRLTLLVFSTLSLIISPSFLKGDASFLEVNGAIDFFASPSKGSVRSSSSDVMTSPMQADKKDITMKDELFSPNQPIEVPYISISFSYFLIFRYLMTYLSIECFA